MDLNIIFGERVMAYTPQFSDLAPLDVHIKKLEMKKCIKFLLIEIKFYNETSLVFEVQNPKTKEQQLIIP